MYVQYSFFDKEIWSIYATLNTCIPLILFIIFRQTLDIQTLTLSSLIGMMRGNLLSKIIFTTFLSLLSFQNKLDIKRLFISIISIIIIHYIPYNNFIQLKIYNNKYLLFLFRRTIFLWIFYFMYKIIITINS